MFYLEGVCYENRIYHKKINALFIKIFHSLSLESPSNFNFRLLFLFCCPAFWVFCDKAVTYFFLPKTSIDLSFAKLLFFIVFPLSIFLLICYLIHCWLLNSCSVILELEFGFTASQIHSERSYNSFHCLLVSLAHF